MMNRPHICTYRVSGGSPHLVRSPVSIDHAPQHIGCRAVLGVLELGRPASQALTSAAGACWGTCATEQHCPAAARYARPQSSEMHIPHIDGIGADASSERL